MAVQLAPITENTTLDITLFELIALVNELEERNLKLINDIKISTNFADLQLRVSE